MTVSARVPRQAGDAPAAPPKTGPEKAMPFDVSQLRDVQAARNYLANVKRLGRADLYPAAFRRLCELSGQAHDDPVAFEFWRAIIALEEILRDARGKTVRLGRTRPKIAQVGELRTMEDLVLARKESEGFRLLVEHGLGDLTAEYIVLRHSDRFSPEAAAAARERLEGAGIPLPSEVA
jgi:hypothetical protein